MGTTLAFTFGVLSTIAVILFAVLVWGIVLVNKLQIRLNGVRERFDDLDRRLSNDRYETHSQIQHLHDTIQKEFGNLERRLYSYTDSRIDKLSESMNKKQLLKDSKTIN